MSAAARAERQRSAREVNEQDVRALVREAIERHLGRPGSRASKGRAGKRSKLVTGTRDVTRPLPLTPLTPSHMSSYMSSLAAKSTTVCASSSHGCAATTAGSVSPTVTSPMAKPSILVTYKLPSSAIEPLTTVGDVEVYRDGVLSKEELIRRVKGKHALVVAALDKIDKDVIDAGSDLKIVSNVAVGYNNLDVPYARSKGIVLTNTPDVLTEATANMAITLILAVTRRIVEGDRVVRRGDWKGFALDFMIGSDVRDRQLGIVGLGRIGLAVAEKARHFGMAIAYHNPSARSVPGYESMSLDQLLATSDVISLHVPLSPQTRHLIDRTALSRMKRSAYLINTSRGPVVDEDALAWALREGIIKGAGLDVYEDEPRIHPGLLALENVVLVPHMASATAETRAAMYRPRRPERRECPPTASRPSLRYRKERRSRDAPARGGHHRPRAAGRREDLPVARRGSLPGHDRNAACPRGRRTRRPMPHRSACSKRRPRRRRCRS